ncbi:hypothetical protein AWENTII_002927 [Aspergillus wentii]|nr:hypothetical protein MW887_007521 [Aspergillus wentii]
MESAPAASEPGTKAIIEHKSGPKRYSIGFEGSKLQTVLSEGSKHHHDNNPHPRGILKQPTSAFPFENDRHSSPHIAPKPVESVRLEVGQPSQSKPPASDIMKVHAYRRRGNSITKDRDSAIVCDKIEIGSGDILMGGSVMPEESNIQNIQAAIVPEGPQW